MPVIGNIDIGMRVRTGQFRSGLGSASRMLGGFAKGVSPTNAALIGFSGAAAAAGAAAFGLKRGFSEVVSTTREFQQAMNSSLAIMGDVSSKMRGEMTAAAMDVAKATKFSATEAAESYFFLASAGLNAKQSMEALPVVARFAQAGMFDMATATDLATDAQSALGLTSKDNATNLANLTRTTDVLVKANTLANASVEQFSKALTNQAGVMLRQAGKSIEEGVAVLSVFADQGVKAEEAGTKLAIVLRDLQTKALQNKAAFSQMGLSVFDNNGNMRHMADIIANLEQTLNGMSTAQKKATLLMLGFSDKSVGALQALIGTSNQMRRYNDELNRSGGITAKVADKQMSPFEKAINRISAAWDRLKITIGEPLIAELGILLTELANSLDSTKMQTNGLAEGFGLLADGVRFTVRAFQVGLAQFYSTRAALNAIIGVVAQLTARFNPLVKIFDFITGNDLAGAIDSFGDSMLKVASEDMTKANQNFNKAFGQHAQTNIVATTTEVDKAANAVQRFGQRAQVAHGQWGESIEDGVTKAHKMMLTLREQIRTYGMTAEQLDLLKLKQQGATRAQLMHIMAMRQHLNMLETNKKKEAELRDAMQSRQDALKNAAREVIEATKSPAEKFREQLVKLRELLARGLINRRQFAIALKQAHDQFFPKTDAGPQQKLAPENRLAGAVKFGSAEAQQTLLRHRMRGGQQPLNKIEKHNRDQLVEQQRANQHLRDIRDQRFEVLEF